MYNPESTPRPDDPFGYQVFLTPADNPLKVLNAIIIDHVLAIARGFDAETSISNFVTIFEMVYADVLKLATSETNAHQHITLTPGPYVMLTVGDTGHGMTPEVQARIFDPFFSTKFTSRELGLAAALGIVKGHGGSILVKNRAGGGTTFQVFLPFAGTTIMNRLPSGLRICTKT